MRFLAAALSAATLAFASGADAPKVPRAKIANAEKLVNTQLAAIVPEEPYFLIGLARGAYIDGVGVVFSAEINLATGPTVSPFKQDISRDQIEKLREKKESRLPLLKTRMINIVGSMANYLDTMPPGEEFVFAVTLLRYPWEDPAGIPAQIVMRVPRAKLLEAQRSKTPIDKAIGVREY